MRGARWRYIYIYLRKGVNMKESHEKQMTKTGWQRILALVLALSMLIIPNQFPSKASAAEGEYTGPANFFVDDFTDDRYLDGVTYKWATMGEKIGTITDGVFRFAYTASSGAYNNYLYPTVIGADGTNYGDQWTDYTMEFDARRIGAAEGNGVVNGLTYRV